MEKLPKGLKNSLKIQDSYVQANIKFSDEMLIFDESRVGVILYQITYYIHRSKASPKIKECRGVMDISRALGLDKRTVSKYVKILDKENIIAIGKRKIIANPVVFFKGAVAAKQKAWDDYQKEAYQLRNTINKSDDMKKYDPTKNLEKNRVIDRKIKTRKEQVEALLKEIEELRQQKTSH